MSAGTGVPATQRSRRKVMRLVKAQSLTDTVDAINEVFFAGGKLAKADRLEAARWIAARQGLPRSYAGMFAPTERDFREGVRVFTGERMRTGAGTAHVLGEEAMRALILLDVPDRAVQAALARAPEGMNARLRDAEARGYAVGKYCCGTCSAAFWRNLAVGGLERAERRLASGMKELRGARLGDGKWRTFPFWYTLLALSEIALPGAVGEMRYAAPVCERYLARPGTRDKFTRRRRAVAERVLGKC
jgi:hypothetical protein